MPLAGPGVRIPTTNNVIIPPSISILSMDGQEIGLISDIDITSTRRVERIRVVKASAAGRVVEQTPAPEDLSIRCTGFALYTSTLIGSLIKGSEGANAVFHSLNTQYQLFWIKVKEVHPVSQKTIITQYGDCWLTDYSHPISIRNLYIAETATVQPSWVKTVEVSDEGETDISWPVEIAQ